MTDIPPASDPYFFGYGSLVNRATHGYGEAHPAHVRGWRRVWRHTARRPVAFLSVRPDPQGAIDGLIASVPGADWAALDLREAGYDRMPLVDSVIHRLERAAEIALYSIPDHAHQPPSLRYPILLSYIDVVVQGYLREFGEAGVAGFFDSTEGWDAPILDDRAAPQYPRHQRLSADERALVDDHLAALDVQIAGRVAG